MRAYFTHWAAVARRLRKAEGWLLIFDYDCALTALALRPSKTRLSEAMRGKLQRLSRQDNCSVAVISERSLSDVRRRVGLNHIIYIGNHGLEIESNGWGFVHPAAPDMERDVQTLKHLFQNVLATTKGAILEDKRCSLTIHLSRMKPTAIRILKMKVRDCLESAKFGKRRFFFQFDRNMLNILPNLHWDKGSAAHWLKHVMPRRTLMFYTGGGPTDEDAFRALATEDITLRVGKNKDSAADYYVQQQSDISRVLDKLIALGRLGTA